MFGLFLNHWRLLFIIFTYTRNSCSPSIFLSSFFFFTLCCYFCLFLHPYSVIQITHTYYIYIQKSPGDVFFFFFVWLLSRHFRILSIYFCFFNFSSENYGWDKSEKWWNFSLSLSTVISTILYIIYIYKFMCVNNTRMYLVKKTDMDVCLLFFSFVEYSINFFLFFFSNQK